MLCQNCQQNQATVHLVKAINGQTQELHLCEQCAQKTPQLNSVFQPGSAPDFLQALFGFMPSSTPAATERVQESCPRCGMTFDQITQAGKLGCSTCYEKFEPRLGSLLRRIHGGGQHVGKIPLRRGVAIKEKVELKKLKDNLQTLIQLEEFEKAAFIRDQIRQLEQKMGG